MDGERPGNTAEHFLKKMSIAFDFHTMRIGIERDSFSSSNQRKTLNGLGSAHLFSSAHSTRYLYIYPTAITVEIDVAFGGPETISDPTLFVQQKIICYKHLQYVSQPRLADSYFLPGTMLTLFGKMLLMIQS